MRLFTLCLVLLTSTYSLAQSSLDSADEAFENRDGNRSEIQNALALYVQAIDEVRDVEDKIYAVEQIGRLSNYENSLLAKDRSTKDYRIELFDSCLLATDKIAPEKIGEKTPAYFYVRGLCLAQWAKARGIAASLFKTKELIGYLESGRKLDPSYEGGGYDRILSVIYINLPSINVFGPTRNYKLSLKHSTAAINSPAYEGAFNPAYETGNYFFNAYEYQADALAKSGKKSQAIALLKAAVARIERGDINPDREPETKVDLKNLKLLLNDL
jgi:hypothetical protein